MEGVYILRFDQPLGNEKHQAQYYVGWTKNLEGRLYHHRRGTGARMTAAAAKMGIGFEVVLFIPGADRSVERAIKNRKNTRKFVEAYQRRMAREMVQ